MIYEGGYLMKIKRMYEKTLAIVLSVILIVLTSSSVLFIDNSIVVKAENVWNDTLLVSNGDFSEGDEGWNVTFSETNTKHGYGFSNGYFEVYDDDGVNMTFSISQQIKNLPAGTYRLVYKYFSYEWDDNGVNVSVSSSSYTIPKGTGWENWVSVSDENTFTLTEAGDVTIEVSGTTCKWIKFGIDDIALERESDSTDPDDTASDGELLNGDFETEENWTITGFNYTYSTDTPVGNNNHALLIDTYSVSGSTDISISQKIKNLPAGTYKLVYDVYGNAGAAFPLTGKVLNASDEVIATAASVNMTENWDSGYDSTSTQTFTVEDNATITVEISGSVPASYWILLDNVALEKVTESTRNLDYFDFDTEVSDYPVVDSKLYVDKVDGLMNDFITGFDVSSYVAIRKSGATFKDFDGNVLSDQGFFDLLAESGVNYIRVRVWVNPKDEDGNTYGGGACDLETAKQIGLYATKAGMKVLVDFHYSDFWTDPGKQSVPKSWATLTLDEKAETLKKYTEDSLTYLINAGVEVGMVQVGNETTNGFCGEDNWTNMCKLFEAGSQGIRNVEAATEKKIMIVIHFTNPEAGNFNTFAKNLEINNVVYDVFATSYYPYWHGTLDNLKSELNKIANNYNKYVMVAETSYARTFEDGDGHENTENETKTSDVFPYPVSVQGQVTHVRNVIDTVASIDNNKGIGVFYWEPAWIPVQVYDAMADDSEEVLTQNKALWEKDGSGWATSYAGDYDEGAAEWFGGSAVDNEAVFDFDGTALESLKVYNLVRGGATGDNYMLAMEDTTVECYLGDEIELPATVTGVYANQETTQVDVVWSENDISEALYSGVGDYPISGVATFGGKEFSVTCTLKLSVENYLVNPSFEDSDTSMWIKDGTSADNIYRRSNGGNYRTGTYAFHFWDSNPLEYTFYQTVTVDKGVYDAGCFLEGGDCGDDYTVEFFVLVDGVEYQTKNAEFKGYKAWQNPEISDIKVNEDGTEITVGIRALDIAGGGWGAYDDFYLNKSVDDVEYHIIEGANSEYNEDEGGNIIIKSDGPFVKFVEVKVDGDVLDSKNYKAKKGSTVITLLKSYLDTLDEGKHEIEIVFTNGSANTDIDVIKKDDDSTTPKAEEPKAEEPTPEEPTPEEPTVKYLSMYRLYNPNSGEHFYTSNEAEKNNLVKLGWKYEGVAWNAPETSDVPVYRLYNPNAGDHHYTVSEAERDFLVKVGWKYEGIGWYSESKDGNPVYRLYNPNAKTGTHHYTVNKEEKDFLVKLGWRDEGTGWYGK